MKLMSLYSTLLLCSNILLINGISEFQNIQGFLKVIGKTQTSSIAEMHNFFDTSTLELEASFTQYEEKTLCFLESLFDSNQLDSFIDIFQPSYPFSFSLNRETLALAYKKLIVRNQYQVPSSTRLSFLSDQMEASLRQWQSEVEMKGPSQDPYHQILPPLGTHWRSTVESLIDTIKVNGTLFHSYQVLQYEPQVFLWSVYRDTYSSRSLAFQGMQASRLYQSLWLLGLERSQHYMHFRTQGMLSNPKREFLPFRNERICHIYAWYLLNEVLGVKPNTFSQIVEYGGGSGDLVAAHDNMGFRGTHVIYDMQPMLLMQRYFLRFSGHAVFLLTEENKETLHDMARDSTTELTTLLVSPSLLSSHLLPDRSEEALATTLLLATYSLTESDLESRSRFISQIHRIGVLFISGNEDHFGNNNMDYILGLTQSDLIDYQCVFLPGNFQDEFFFMAIRSDLVLAIDPYDKFDKVYDQSIGRCPMLVRKE